MAISRKPAACSSRVAARTLGRATVRREVHPVAIRWPRLAGARHLRKALPGTTALTAVAMLGWLMLPEGALARPTGGVVTQGEAEIIYGETSVTIQQASDRVIIEWESFDVGAHESVIFNQPHALAAALNIVLGGGPTQVLGNIEANGQVFISNPSGVAFGAGANVDVASVVATTLSLMNRDAFMNEDALDFALAEGGDPTAVVENHGTIRASGMAALVGPGARNSGTIVADVTVIGAGEGFALDYYGDGLINFAITAPTTVRPVGSDGQPVDALVVNDGSILSDGGRVILTADAAAAVIDTVINVDGIVQARTIENRDGQVVLLGGDEGTVTVAGTIDATGDDAGEAGGAVHVLGDTVVLAEGADIDVSGQAGGGTALIGGDYLGGPLQPGGHIAYAAPEEALSGTRITIDPVEAFETDGHIPTADIAYFAEGASVTADATVDGDGGRVILWADEATQFSGAISVRGGAEGGDGGFVETSGGINLGVAASASVDALAPNGDVGDWLLDPRSVTIQTGGGATLLQIADAGDTTNDLVVDPATLNAALANVSIVASETITVTNAVSIAAAGVGLTATAGTSITVDANVTTNNGDVTFVTDDLAINAAVNAGTAGVAIRRASGGEIRLGGAAAGLHLTQAELNRITAGALTVGHSVIGSSNTTALTVDGADLSAFATVGLNGASGSTISFSGASTFAAVTAKADTISVANGATVGATDTVVFDAATVTLDGNVSATNGISGTAGTVNVLGSAGGAELQDAVDVAAAGATVSVSAGSYAGVTIDVADLTLDGAGATTVVNAASPAVTIAADGVTVQDLLLQGTGAAGEVGVLLDGTAAPDLTDIEIINVDMSNLVDGVRSQGDIGDGVTANVDVTVRGTSSADRAAFEDFGENAIDVGDTDGDAVYLIRDVILRDGADIDTVSAGGEGFLFGAIGGATIQGVDISDTVGDGIEFAAQTDANILIGGADAVDANTITGGSYGITFLGVAGGTLTVANNTLIRSASYVGLYVVNISNGADVAVVGNDEIRGVDGIAVSGGTFTDSSITIAGNSDIIGEAGDALLINNNIVNSVVVIGSGTATVEGSAINFGGNGQIIGQNEAIDINPMSGSQVSIVDNGLMQGQTGIGMEFEGNLTSGSVAVTGNDTITGATRGIGFVGSVGGTATVTIDGNGQATQGGVAYDGTAAIDLATFATTGTIHGGTQSAIHFGDVLGDASVTVSRNIIDGNADGIAFGQIGSSETTAVHNNIIVGATGDGVIFTGDITGRTEVFQNVLADNGDDGVNVRAGADIGTDNLLVQMNFMPGSAFAHGNSGFGFNHQGTGTPDLEVNWWGANSAAGVASAVNGVPAPVGVLASGNDNNRARGDVGVTGLGPFGFQYDPDTWAPPSLDDGADVDRLVPNVRRRENAGDRPGGAAFFSNELGAPFQVDVFSETFDLVEISDPGGLLQPPADGSGRPGDGGGLPSVPVDGAGEPDNAQQTPNGRTDAWDDEDEIGGVTDPAELDGLNSSAGSGDQQAQVETCVVAFLGEVWATAAACE